MVNFRASCPALKYAILLFLIAASAAFTARGQTPPANTAASNASEASDEVNQGLDAFKSGHYEEAIAHFRRAVELDPEMPKAKFYLGVALAQNVVPGLDT